jgi:diguanylate cyclase (GGDEF)-like protein
MEPKSWGMPDLGRDPELSNAMFDLAPVSLWLEDYSGVRALFARWHAEGVRDVREHLKADSARVAECAAAIRLLRVNRRTLQLYRAADAAELQANLHRVLRDDMYGQHVEELGQLWDGRGGFAGRGVNYALSGERLEIEIEATVLPGHELDWSRVLVAIEDMTARNRYERALRASERHAKALFEHSPVSLWLEDFSTIRQLLEEVRGQGITDFRTFIDVHPEFVDRCMQEIRVIDVNRQTLAMFRAPDKPTLLARLNDVFRAEMRPHFAEQLVDLWEGRLFQQREVLNHTLDGEKVHVYLQLSVLPGHEARWEQVLVSLTDISARKKAEAYLEYLGKHDVLTGLRNRTFFNEELSRLERRGPWPVSVVAIDLNGLKSTNDQYGHAAGDALLRRTGEVLAKAVERPCTASRIGGDEFALLLPATDEHGAQQLMEQLRELLALNNQFHGGEAMSLSMGSATAPHGERLEIAVQRADEQMYRDKRAYYARRAHDRRGESRLGGFADDTP